MTVLGLAESFKTMNRPARSNPSVMLIDKFILGKYKRYRR